MPERIPVADRLTPDGRAPDCEYVGAGWPVALTVKLPAALAVKVALDEEVIAGEVPRSATLFALASAA